MSDLSPTRPTRTVRTVRIAVGAVLAVASVAAVIALVTIDLPGRTGDTIAIAAQPPATDSVSVCAGPVLATARDVTQATQVTDAAASSVIAVTSDGGTADPQTLAAPDVTGGAGPAVLTAAASGGERTDLAAASSATVAAPDLAGFAAAACTRPAMESWLATGTATTGSTDLVVLANPGEVPALVTLSVFGAAGETQPAAGQNIVVAARTQQVIPLAAIALGERNPIVRVTASQAPVQASLQSTLTRVLNPGGIDQAAAVGAPADDLVIPGVRVALAPGDSGASDVSTILRLLAPAGDGTATVTITDGNGAVGAPREVPLSAGVPLQLELDGLPIGTYTVSVSAATPVTGAVWSTTGFGAGDDFGWFTRADPLTGATLVAVADGPAPQLALTAAGSDPQAVTVENLAGSESREVTVQPGVTTIIDVAAGATYRLTPSGSGAGIRAAISYAGGGALAGYPVQAGDAEASAITVYPR